jgi:HSF-type DNA-binding
MKAPSPDDLNAMANSDTKVASFPCTLHRMLTEFDRISKDERQSHLHQIISWKEHGMAFKIHDRQKFMNLVMPVWFPRLKYTSWIRQLHCYGFKRIVAEGNDKSCVYHEMFLRDMPELAARIERVPKKKKGHGFMEADQAFDTFTCAPIPAPSFGSAKQDGFCHSPLKSLSPSGYGEGLMTLTKAPSDPLPWPSSHAAHNLLGMGTSVPDQGHGDHGKTSPDDTIFQAFHQVLNSSDDNDCDTSNDLEPLRIFAPGANGFNASRQQL